MIRRPSLEVDDAMAEEIWAKLDPEYDEIDGIILKEIINYKQQKEHHEDTSDESDSDQEVGPMDDQELSPKTASTKFKFNRRSKTAPINFDGDDEVTDDEDMRQTFLKHSLTTKK